MVRSISNRVCYDSLYFSTLIGYRKEHYSRWVKSFVYRGHDNYDYFLNRKLSTNTRKRFWLSEDFCQALCLASGNNKALRERRRFLKP